MLSNLSNARRTRVLIVDNHQAIRATLALLISKLPDFETCGEATNPSDALRLVGETKPDLVVIDISIDDGNGIDLLKQLRSQYENVRILVWSLHGERPYAELAFRAGAMGYITKEQAIGSMTDALRQIAKGNQYFSPSMTKQPEHRTFEGTGDTD
jgi:DNA-binding NarL/FixJ family response regulator